MKGLKLSEIVSVIKPVYTFIRLKPNNSIRNQTTHTLAKTISSLYKSVYHSIKREDAKLIKILGKEFLFGTRFSYEAASKVGYYIYIEKKRIDFYFIIPSHHMSVIKERMSNMWSGLTLEIVEALPSFAETATKYQLVYTKEDALSLETNRTNNNLLNSQLNVVDVLEEGDKVGVYYNFIPTSQFSWRSTYQNTMHKVKTKAPVDRNKLGIGYSLRLLINLVSGIFDSIAEAMNGDRKSQKGEQNALFLERALERMSGGEGPSESTVRKGNATILDTQIIVMSESQSRLRQHNNARSLAQSFDVVAGDNRLTTRVYKKPINFTDLRVGGAEVNKVGDEEAQNFIALAGRDLLERYNFIDKVETQETQVPEELREGTMCIGDNTFRGHQQKSYLTRHKEYKNLSLVVIGPQRSGKTTLFGNLTKNAIDNGECVILFDFIENCEMSTQVASLFPKDKVLNIYCDNVENAQGLGYNEVRMSDDPFTQYTNAKLQTTQLMDLLNAVNTEDKRLAPKMERYLESAANVTFLSGGSIRDVFSVLTNHNARASYIHKIPKEQDENLTEYVDSLRELDERDNKSGIIVGTKLSAVVGIIDRLTKLKHNPYMELMLKKPTQGNIDLVTEMEKNQLICIKMPEDMFNTDTERDIYTTYWISKVWLALQIRASLIRDKDNRKTVNLIIDELYQVENTESFLSEKLNRLSKFRLKPIVSCHYLSQLSHMKKELSGANASYMLISGSDKNNFNELKDELRPFQVEDLLNLPEHHSMNLIKTKDGYGRFITKLPPPVS